VALAQAERPLADVLRAADRRHPVPSLAAALAAPGLGVVAEVKRASPSRGPIAPIPDAPTLAAAYTAGGAAAVSVLTEPRWFGGDLGDLVAVAGRVDVPVLRKDFVVDVYQVAEARAAGAAAVLLMVAALPVRALAGLLAACGDLGLEALIEVHDDAEAALAAEVIDTVLGERPVAVGVNARDLATLAVDPDRFAAVRASLPPTALAVSESGIRGPADAARAAALGADAVLVGEHVASAPDPAAAVAALVTAGAGRQPAPGPAADPAAAAP